MVTVPVATPTAVTVGTPYSRPTMAARDSEPPASQTQPAMLANAGVQLGEVDSQTSTSPGWMRCRLPALLSTRAGPRAAGTPVGVLAVACEFVVATARRSAMMVLKSRKFPGR